MSRPPLTRTAVWRRERACVPLVKVDEGTAARAVTARVNELAAARRRPARRTRRAA